MMWASVQLQLQQLLLNDGAFAGWHVRLQLHDAYVHSRLHAIFYTVAGGMTEFFDTSSMLIDCIA